MTDSHQHAAGTTGVFFARIIDYAGLFPPALLPLPDAAAHYTSYSRSSASWMLGRFVCPVARLRDLCESAHLFSAAVPLSVIGSRSANADSFISSFADDLEKILTALSSESDPFRVESMELALPNPWDFTDVETVENLLGRLGNQAASAGVSGIEIYLEVPLDAQFRSRAPLLLEGMKQFAERQYASSGISAGLKFRCGGANAAAVPPSAHLANAIAACQAAGVRFKATAGLHHPLPYFDSVLGVIAHGFLNVFGAAILTSAHQLTESTICEILADRDISHFVFTENSFSWQHLSAAREIVRDARSRFATSFGSCSFEEPVEGLRLLRLV